VGRSVVVAALVILASRGAAPAAAQLRPLDPLPVGLFHPTSPPVTLQLGAGAFLDQRASLAGTTGTLAEIGNFRGVWRTGRVALEVGGTVLRAFQDDASFAPPQEDVDPESGPRRRDSGDYRVATAVRVTPERWPVMGFVRFGTRLPTTDNTVGLDRDQTDFFASVGAHARPGPWGLAVEAGLGIFGTRHTRLEQADVVTYAAAIEHRLGPITPGILVLGHADGMPDGSIRGSEELAELRLGARAGGRIWASAYWVAGLTDFSPASGVIVAIGWGAR
jgi:hypothetical protein